jgi:hypothetical protein
MKQKKPVPQKRPRLVNALNLLLVLACALTIAYLLWKDPYMLRAYHFFGLLTVAAVTVLIKKARPGCPVLKRKPHLFSVSYGCVLLSTLLYIAFLQPCTVARAQETLQSQGYAGVVFAGDYGAQAIALTQTPYEGEECAQADGLGYYLFDAQKNGARWGVFVRVTSGEIAALDRQMKTRFFKWFLTGQARKIFSHYAKTPPFFTLPSLPEGSFCFFAAPRTFIV